MHRGHLTRIVEAEVYVTGVFQDSVHRGCLGKTAGAKVGHRLGDPRALSIRTGQL